jgi:hypothetical protein
VAISDPATAHFTAHKSLGNTSIAYKPRHTHTHTHPWSTRRKKQNCDNLYFHWHNKIQNRLASFSLRNPTLTTFIDDPCLRIFSGCGRWSQINFTLPSYNVSETHPQEVLHNEGYITATVWLYGEDSHHRMFVFYTGVGKLCAVPQSMPAACSKLTHSCVLFLIH